MRIYMQRPAADRRSSRYFQLLLQEDLLGGWTVISESGSDGGGRRVNQTHYALREDAESAMAAARDDYLRRGYRVVFVEGARPDGQG
ncbi:MAG TPA: hypothetical protein ENJ19_05795 [Gammaproteobacteria bacterium]|nr:hypothetical protein [Gammaproteobacteria bacterium]